MLSFPSSKRKVWLITGLSLVAATQASSPAQAFSIFTGVDPNGDRHVNLGCASGCPNATAAETAFLAQLLGVGTETFESFAASTTTPLLLSFPGAGNATLSQGSGIIESVPAGTTDDNGRYGVSATKFLEVDANASFNGNNLRIDFQNPVAAFGFYGIDIGDFNGTLRIATDNANIGTLNVPTAPLLLADGSVLFWGIITSPADGPISQLHFQATPGEGDVFGFDNMTIGSREQVDPNPAPAPLAIAGLPIAFGSLRKLRHFSSLLPSRAAGARGTRR
ncbi:MAG: hypothetical protein ACOVQK_03145 [Cyanobium sp.]|jgi:hypothetical protein